MPKPDTFPTLYNHCRKLTIAFLKQHGYLNMFTHKSGVITWSIDSEKVAAISVTTHMNAYDAYIELHYLKDGEDVRYTVQLVPVASNLGKGVLWSFICPRTGISCRTLYLFNGYFYHRTGIKNAMYESQTDSHKNRFALRQYDKWQAAYDAKRAMREKHYTKHYKGKPTKRHLKHLRQIEAGEGISQVELLMML